MLENKPKLGQMLLEAALITEEKLKIAIRQQQRTGEKLGAIIVKLGYVSDMEMTRFLAKQQNLKVVDVENIILPENLIKKVPREIIERHSVLPVSLKDGLITLAVSDPTDYEAIDDVQLATDFRVEIIMSPRQSILNAIREFYSKIDSKRYTDGHDLLDDPVSVEDVNINDLSDELKSLNADVNLIQQALITILLEKKLFTKKDLFKKINEIKNNI